ncbi:unnamed protein product [Orchesella dallaii]|uniref:Endothelin-converting enzyme 1 n=1 Tax=Orchesella dallaii TaxID=48710 RepID=A0ABP1Q8M7_9HEXA
MGARWDLQLRLLLWVVLASLVIVPLAKAQRSPPTNQRRGQDEFQKNLKQLQELKQLATKGGHSNPDSITKFDPQVCYTYDCIEAAKEFMVATNFTLNPCQDGNWLRYTCVRRTMIIEGDDELDDMHQQGQVGYLGSVALGQTLAILESKNLPPILKKAATYYAQCEKWKHGITEKDQVDGILKYLNTFGDWPLLTGKNAPGPKFNWQKMMANTMKIAVTYGVAPYLFDIFIENDDIPLLFTGELDLHLSDNEIIEVVKILSKGRRNITVNDKQLKEMKQFMEKLTHPAEDKIGVNSIKNITRQHNFGRNFKLDEFYKEMLAGTRVKVTPDTLVSSDIEWLKKHVKTINEADPRVVSNVLFLQTAAALLSRLTTLTHAEDLPDLEKYRSNGPLDCVRDAYEKFDYAMSHEYIRRYYDHNGTPIVVKLVDDLKYGFVKAVEKSKFLTSQSKVFAIDKAKDIHTFIAAENWVLNEEKLKQYYTKMEVSQDKDFVSNHVAGLRFQWAKFLELKDANIFNYLVGDAYTGYLGSRYNHHFNEIRIQASLAQKPLFNFRYPGFMNYGGIGTIIAHELAHSFDTNGVHFDKQGQRGDFWDESSYDNYYKWANAVVKDYGSGRHNEVDPWGSRALANIDHGQAINDHIADIVGVYMAYNAYQKYLADLKIDGKKEMVLPGLKQFTPQQLFWMKYANMWCEHTEKSYLHVLRHFNMHSPGNVRATLPLTRSKEWAKDFSCPAPTKFDF